MTADKVSYNWSEKTIQICRHCKGSGTEEERLNMDETKIVACSRCNGTGRVVKTVTVLYEPFKDES